MENKILAGMAVEVKEDNPEERILDFVGSTELLDRDGEIIKSEGWGLDNYRKNPVVLFAHRYGEPAVAKAVDVRVEKGKLNFKIAFPTREDYPFADTLYRLYKGRYMRGVSVGFMPDEWEWEEKGNNSIRVYTKTELVELSLVPVPINPDALMKSQGIKKAFQDGQIAEGDIDDMKEALSKIPKIEDKSAIPYKKDPLAPESEKSEAPDSKDVEPENTKKSYLDTLLQDLRAERHQGNLMADELIETLKTMKEKNNG